MVIGDNPAVDFCPNHGIAHFAVDHIGKVYRGCTGGEIDNVSLRGKHKDFVPEHIDFEIVEEVCRVRLLLALEQPPYPGKLILITLMERSAPVTQLVLPVGGNAVFCRGMHIPGPDLHFKRDALRADYRGMYALVHVRLWRGNIVLESAGDRVPQGVHDAKHRVAVRNRIDNDPEGTEVENPADIDFLGVHFAVNTVYMLDAAVNSGADAFFLQPGIHSGFHGGHKCLEFRHLALKRFHDFAVSVRIQILQCQIFQFPLGLLHTEAV